MSDSRGVRANFELDAVAHQLQDKRSSKRRSAAKKLRKARLITAVPALIDALKFEVTDKRTWETQYQMVMALAETGSTDALPLLRNLSSMDLEPMVLLAVGDALVRLATNIDHALNEALASKRPLTEGAIRAIAMLRAIPSPSTIQAILDYSSTQKHPEVRFWVAAAAPGWEARGLKDFLSACLKDPLEDTRRAAAAALEKRYLKWSPL